MRFAADRAARFRKSLPGVLCAPAVDRRSYAQSLMRFVLKFAFASAFQQNVFVFHVAALRWLFWAALQPLCAPRDLVKQHMACAYPLLLISRPFPGGHPIYIGVCFMSKQAYPMSLLSPHFSGCPIRPETSQNCPVESWICSLVMALFYGKPVSPASSQEAFVISLRQPFGAGPVVLCCHSQRSEISKH